MKKILVILILMIAVPALSQTVSSITSISAPICASPGQTIAVTFTVNSDSFFGNVYYDVYFSTSSTIATGAWSDYMNTTITCPAGTAGGYSFFNEGLTSNTEIQDVVVPSTGYSGYIIVAAEVGLPNISCSSVNGNIAFVYPCSTPTVTETATNTPTSTATNTATNTPAHTYTATQTATNTATNTATETATNTATATRTNTATETATNTATQTATNTFTYTPTNTPTATWTKTNTPTATNTPTSIFTPTNTATPSLDELNRETTQREVYLVLKYLVYGTPTGTVTPLP